MRRERFWAERGGSPAARLRCLLRSRRNFPRSQRFVALPAPIASYERSAARGEHRARRVDPDAERARQDAAQDSGASCAGRRVARGASAAAPRDRAPLDRSDQMVPGRPAVSNRPTGSAPDHLGLQAARLNFPDAGLTSARHRFQPCPARAPLRRTVFDASSSAARRRATPDRVCGSNCCEGEETCLDPGRSLCCGGLTGRACGRPIGATNGVCESWKGTMSERDRRVLPCRRRPTTAGNTVPRHGTPSR